MRSARTLIAAAFLGAVAAATASADDAPTRTREAVAAVVNDEIITRYEVEETLLFEREYQAILRQYPGDAGLDLKREWRRQAIDVLIDERLFLRQAREERMGLTTADEAEIEDLLTRRAREVGGIEALEKALLERGMTLARYRERFRRQKLASKVLAKNVAREAYIRPEEVRAYYDEHKADWRQPGYVEVRHIFISKRRVPDDARRREIADEVVAGARRGGDFAALAKKHSHDPHAEDGGLWRFTGKPEFIAPVADAAAALREGEIEGPIESPVGLHVLKMERVQADRIAPFAEVQDEVRDILKKRTWSERLARWRRDLHSKAYIKVFLD